MTRTTTANRRLAKKRVKCLNEALCPPVADSVLADSLVLPCLPAGRETRPNAKPQTVCDLNQLLMKQVIEYYLTDGRN
jgi:hypothetical protein